MNNRVGVAWPRSCGLVLLAACAVVGCDESADKEIIQYIHQVKAQKPTSLEPIVFAPAQPTFIYPKNEHRRSPFLPRVDDYHETKLALSRTRLNLPLKSSLIQINYANARDIAALIQDKNNSLLSKRGHLSVDGRTNTLW